MRSCNVPNARSIRPLACGLLAQMMSIFNANSARPNWVTPSPPAASLLFTRKIATLLQIGASRPKVIKCQFRGDEPQLHQPARCIIHESQQRARRTAVLEPGVLRAVDLHQFAQAIAPPTRLVRERKTMPTVLPQPIGDHPAAQGLARDRATVTLGQLLRRQGRAEIGVLLAHDRQRQLANLGRQPMVARFTAALGDQAPGTVLLQTAQQTKHLTPLQADQLAGVGNAKTT